MVLISVAVVAFIAPIASGSWINVGMDRSGAADTLTAGASDTSQVIRVGHYDGLFLAFGAHADSASVTVEYSLDGTNWTTAGTSGITTAASAGTAAYKVRFAEHVTAKATKTGNTGDHLLPFTLVRIIVKNEDKAHNEVGSGKSPAKDIHVRLRGVKQ